MTHSSPVRRVDKGFIRGTHRLIDPRETIERIEGLAPALGITRVANITGLDTIGIPTVSVYRPNSRSLVVAQGKGLTLAAAKASGLMEALEHHHAERASLPLRLATLKELRLDNAVVDVEKLAAPAAGHFHSDLRILWVEGLDILNDKAVWLPYECVHLDCTLPVLPGAGCFDCSSNGLASGNHQLEAISHGLCELVERDAYARFQASDLAAQAERRLDLATVSDGDCQEVLARYEAAGVLVAVWEITTESRIPAFHCVAVDREGDGWRKVAASAGMGCHPARGIALLRALTEAAQSRLTSIAGARDDLKRRQEEVIRAGDVVGGLRIDLESEEPRCDYRSVPTFESGTFDEDVAWLLERLQAFGARRAVMIDLTHPGLDVPVVRVVVPGLLGIAHH